MKIERQLDRLLQSAAHAGNEPATEAPFGFATRVVAAWRASSPDESREIAQLLRRVVMIAVALTVLGTAAGYREISTTVPSTESLTNGYAIADSAIQTGALE